MIPQRIVRVRSEVQDAAPGHSPARRDRRGARGSMNNQGGTVWLRVTCILLAVLVGFEAQAARLGGEVTPVETSAFPEGTATLERSCRASVYVSYPQAPASIQVGDIVRVAIELGAGRIVGGTLLSINRVRFDLDCDSASLGNCPDDGEVASYQGGLTTNCGVAIASSHFPGDTLTNQIVFTPSTPIVVPAGVRSFCSIEFNVRIESLSNDGTPDTIEQVGGLFASLGDGVCDTSPPIAVGRLNSGQICIGSFCQTLGTSCEPVLDLSYPEAPRLQQVGDRARAHLSLGGGHNGLSVPVLVQRVRFNLDCDSSNLSLNCPDDGGVIAYEGNLTTTCPVGFTCSHSPGDTLPNQVIFTADGPLLIPADTADFCSLDFDVRLETTSNDATPNLVEQTIAVERSLDDAQCEILGRSRSGEDTSSSFLEICPVCDDGNQCNGLEVCDGETGCVPGDPLVCDDQNVCTDDVCDPTLFEGDPCAYTDTSARCEDDDVCTDDACDPVLGCVHDSNAARCDDGNLCTADVCDPAFGCRNTLGVCDDQNVCTVDHCDPAVGCVTRAVSCDDGNVCTQDSCDPVSGCLHAPDAACGTSPRPIGYWKRLCRGRSPSGDALGPADVACVQTACPFASVSSVAELCDRLTPDPPGDACAKAEAQFLVLELNRCRGRVSDADPIHPACGQGQAVGEARVLIE